ncbi:MAG: cardiolipin synthase [Fusobacteriaceae bacterium]|nr:cardiolipin synthase [Fusobacteriaceae bacterium]
MITFIKANLLLVLNIFFIMIVIFFERKRVINTLGWVLILSLTSYIGFFFYLFFGLGFRKRKRLKNNNDNFIFQKFLIRRNELIEKANKIELKKDYFDLVYYLEYNLKSLYYPSNEITLYTDGVDFFNVLKQNIANAKVFIHIEYYIFRNDTLGTEIKNLLIKKAKEGVEIKFIYDGMGSLSVKDRFFNDLREAGAEVECFFPPTLLPFNIRWNFRNHRKIVVIDGQEAYVGGFNVGDEYLGKNKKFGYWRDTQLKIEGDIIDSIEAEFLMDWLFVKKQKISKDFETDKYFPEREPKGSIDMQICSSGPNYDHPYIKDSIVKLISKAKKSIYIQTPYFIPDDTIQDLLKIAVLSGVRVNIMIPNKPDHIFVYWATLYNAGELLELGAKVYTYENGFLHSKVLIVDDEVSTIGTANMDMRSFYVNFEIKTIIYNEAFALKLKEEFYRDIKLSKELTLEKYRNRGRKVKIKESISRLVSPIL